MSLICCIFPKTPSDGFTVFALQITKDQLTLTHYTTTEFQCHVTITGTATPFPGLDRLLRCQVVEAPKISRQSAHEGGKVSSKHRPPLHPRKHPWYSFLLEAESTPRLQCSQKDEIEHKSQRPPQKSNPWPYSL
jgi:hypothetical protein